MGMMRRCSRRVAARCVLLMLLCAAAGGAQERPSEYAVKAAYLFTFGKFVTWPQTANLPAGNFTICILGHDPFDGALDAMIAQGRIAGRPAAARRVSKPGDIAACQVVFISASEEKQLGHILASMEHTQVLTVSDIAGFCRRGGMIEFVLDGDKVRFNVNLGAARSAGLVFSSELLKVARRVEQGAGEGQ